ncbi:unnamed protein product [Eretmochelys imbricata]
MPVPSVEMFIFHSSSSAASLCLAGSPEIDQLSETCLAIQKKKKQHIIEHDDHLMENELFILKMPGTSFPEYCTASGGADIFAKDITAE